MKVIRILVILAVLAVLMPAPQPAAAQAGLPPLCSRVQVQNKGTLAADPVTLNFYRVGDNDGVAEYSYTDPVAIPVDVSRGYDISSATFSTLLTGSYAVVITSNQPLNSVVNQITCTGSTPLVGGGHSGFEQRDVNTTLYLPYVTSRYTAANWSFALAIQNAGSTTGTNVRIDFYLRNQSAITETFTNTNLKAGETWYIDLSAGSPYATAALNGFTGSATITSDVPVAAIANYAPIAGTKLLSYNGTAVPSQKLFATQMSRRYSSPSLYTGGFTIYNPNATATPIRVKFYNTASTTPICTVDKTLAANETWAEITTQVGAGLRTPCTTGSMADGYNGYMTVEVTSGANKILGLFNFDSIAGHAAAGAMIPVEQAATTSYHPMIVRNFNTYQSGFTVINTSSNALTLRIDYIKDDGTIPLTETPALPANGVLSIYAGGKAALGNFVGGVKITITAGTGAILGHANLVSPTVESYTLFAPFTP